MRPFIAILLTLLLLATAWQDLLLYATFKIEQNHLAQTVCQNKTKPELDCKASCYFKIELKKQHEQEQKTPYAPSSSVKEKTPFPLPKQEALQAQNELTLGDRVIRILRKTALPPSPFLQGVFKPPSPAAYS